jgi:Tfp pilus assembly protein PilO
MDLKSLSSINVKQIQELLKSRLDIFINILLIVATLCATMFIYNNAQEKKQNLSQQSLMAESKWQVAEQLTKIDKDSKEFLLKFPKGIESDKFTNKLSEIATKNNVQTLSFTPPQKTSSDYVDLRTISFNIASEEYPNILAFIKDIETAPYALRIHKVSASLVETNPVNSMPYLGGGMQQAPETKKYIEVNLEIGLIDLKK